MILPEGCHDGHLKRRGEWYHPVERREKFMLKTETTTWFDVTVSCMVRNEVKSAILPGRAYKINWYTFICIGKRT